MDCYTLSGSAADRVHFHLVPSEFDDVANIALFRPGGTGLCNAFTQLDHAVNLTCSLDEGGATRWSSRRTPPRVTSAQRLNNPVGCTPIGFGDAPTGGGSPGAEMDLYTFDAAAGDQVRVRQTRTSGTQSGLDVAVFRPDGELVGCSFDPFEDPLERTCPIDTTRTYTMLQFDDPIVEPGTGSYAVGIQRLNGPVGCTPLSFGAAPLAGSITAPGGDQLLHVQRSARRADPDRPPDHYGLRRARRGRRRSERRGHLQRDARPARSPPPAPTRSSSISSPTPPPARCGCRPAP